MEKKKQDSQPKKKIFDKKTTFNKKFSPNSNVFSFLDFN